jgi:putative nucleotidyltransferase with HDIG domain
MFVADTDGRVIGAVGSMGLSPGMQLKALTLLKLASSSDGPMFVRVGDKSAILGFAPMTVGDRELIVGTMRVLNDDYLARMAGKGEAYCFYDSERNWVACSDSDEVATTPELRALHAVEQQSQAQVQGVLDGAITAKPTAASLQVDNVDYQLWASRVSLGQAPGMLDEGFLIGFYNSEASDQAGRSTMNLILLSTAIVVVGLVLLGGWVAKRVSEPLVELSGGARRVAEGDFTWKAEMAGAAEITDLAQSFNLMTDSLKDRSESLTKKVLELSTLYEMSRSFSSTLDLRELLESVLDSALRIFEVDRGYVTLRDRDTGAISIQASRGAVEDAEVEAHGSVAEWVVREGRPLVFNPDGPNSSSIDALTGAKAALSVPLSSPEGAIGAITVGTDDQSYRFNSDDVRLLSTIANHVTIAIGNIELFSSLQDAYLATVRSLAAAVDAKDTYTRGHSERVALYSIAIAEELGLAHEQRMALEISAYLHDIGKIGVPEEILLKPGRLSDAEMAEMRHHPLIGANILKPVTFPWPITPVVRHHHEHYDGSGYPAGLRADEIPLLARILSVADAFEAMTSDRPYRSGRSVEDAIEELKRCSGQQFDPRVVVVFSELLARTPEELLLTEDPLAELSTEECRGVFSALFDGVLGSFRRLAGPRLASTVEEELKIRFHDAGLPFDVVRGRVTFTSDPATSWTDEATMQREALRRLDASIARLSGGTLVDHFYADAMSSLSTRMRALATALDFGPIA